MSTQDFRSLQNTEDLWIVRQASRLGAYQQLAEDCFHALAGGWAEDTKTAVILRKTIATCLRSVAEEVGDLKKLVQMDPVQVAYRIEGVDPEDLK
jgi:hypothetical protein